MILQPLQEKKEDEQYLQFCNFCEGFKAPRSHHCRKCNRYDEVYICSAFAPRFNIPSMHSHDSTH